MADCSFWPEIDQHKESFLGETRCGPSYNIILTLDGDASEFASKCCFYSTFMLFFINIPDAAEDAMETLSANQRSGHPGSIDWTIGRRSIESDQFMKWNVFIPS